ncbi:hypothetical protein HDU98_000174 [Podochytrium sp. JEL0797]|nr:hypothetical protein HDU98_000174 [Podochytrium sp. JEL0797]
MPFVVFHHHTNPERWAAAARILNRYADGSRSMDALGVQRVLETDGLEWDTSGLRKYLSEDSRADALSTIPADVITDQLLPRMAALALHLPTLFRNPFPLLLAGRNGSLTFSQHQTACLLANAFFGTLPDQREQFEGTRQFPVLDFRALFQARMYSKVMKAKLDAVFEYFGRILDRPNWDSTKVTFTRRCLGPHEFPDWSTSHTEFPPLSAASTGTIETNGTKCTQADFANEFIGGGVLGQGAVQEEILFLIYPEMLVSLLFCERMADNEVVFLVGVERFCEYTGYASTFAISGPFHDRTEL